MAAISICARPEPLAKGLDTRLPGDFRQPTFPLFAGAQLGPNPGETVATLADHRRGRRPSRRRGDRVGRGRFAEQGDQRRGALTDNRPRRFRHAPGGIGHLGRGRDSNCTSRDRHLRLVLGSRLATASLRRSFSLQSRERILNVVLDRLQDPAAAFRKIAAVFRCRRLLAQRRENGIGVRCRSGIRAVSRRGCMVRNISRRNSRHRPFLKAGPRRFCPLAREQCVGRPHRGLVAVVTGVMMAGSESCTRGIGLARRVTFGAGRGENGIFGPASGCTDFSHERFHLSAHVYCSQMGVQSPGNDQSIPYEHTMLDVKHLARGGMPLQSLSICCETPPYEPSPVTVCFGMS